VDYILWVVLDPKASPGHRFSTFLTMKELPPVDAKDRDGLPGKLARVGPEPHDEQQQLEMARTEA
jgi:hypothetical protein